MNRVAWIIGAWYYSPNSFILSYPVLTVVEYTPTVFHAPIGHVEDHSGHWIAFHNRIKPTSKLSKTKNILGPLSSHSGKSSNNKKNTSKNEKTNPPTFKAVALTTNQPKVSVGIDKNLILSNYKESCI
jgi:hypothetical protein